MNNGHGIFGELWALIIGGWGAAVCGRMVWRTRMAQKGGKFFSRELIYEIPTVCFVYLIGVGLCAHMGWTGPTANAVVAAVSYLGPGGLQSFAQWYVRDNKA